jgi:hypothetical protein
VGFANLWIPKVFAIFPRLKKIVILKTETDVLFLGGLRIIFDPLLSINKKQCDITIVRKQ